MLALGCDVGALATKTVLLEDGVLAAWDVTPNLGRLDRVAEESLARVLARAGVALEAVGRRTGTGWGVNYIGFARDTETMINCLARGAWFLEPGVRTVVDLGGLHTTVIHLGPDGKVLEYRTNDRCAGGTGFFLELACQALEIGLADLEARVRSAARRARIGAQCAVFGESEIVSHVNDGVEPAEILAGLTYSLGIAAATNVRRLGASPDILVTGGVARIESVVRTLEEALQMPVHRPAIDPGLVPALGAALSAGA
ncbi:MAG: acyl-CoA dehydratase activase [Thermodesulfobacteriota bacterium]